MDRYVAVNGCRDNTIGFRVQLLSPCHSLQYVYTIYIYIYIYIYIQHVLHSLCTCM